MCHQKFCYCCSESKWKEDTRGLITIKRIPPSLLQKSLCIVWEGLWENISRAELGDDENVSTGSCSSCRLVSNGREVTPYLCTIYRWYRMTVCIFKEGMSLCRRQEMGTCLGELYISIWRWCGGGGGLAPKYDTGWCKLSYNNNIICPFFDCSRVWQWFRSHPLDR